jgi:hypothetical protein
MNIFDPLISGSLSVSGSGHISGDLTVLGTINATISGTTSNAISASHAASYLLTSSFEQFTGSYTTGSFTGSFGGDGTNLINIPASGVTGLNLTRIADGSVTASVSNTDGLRVNSNTEITGALTISGSITLNGVPVGTGKLDEIVFNSYSSSNDTTNSLQNGRLDTLEVSTSSLNTFTASATGRLNTIESTTGSLNTFTSSASDRLSSIETSTESLNTFTSSATDRLSSIETSTGSLNTFTSSTNGRLTSLESDSSSIRSDFNSFTSSNNTVESTQNGRLSALETSTGSLNSFTTSINSKIEAIETSTSSLNGFTSSINTTIKNRLDADNVISGSIQVSITGTSGFTTFSSSIATIDSAQDVRLNSIEGITGSYATTGSNVFQGNQNITGSLFISENLIVGGSSSINFISQSTLNIGTNLITVNAQNPGTRFGGLAVIDSGSSPTISGSMLFDSIKDEWIFIHQNQGTVTSSVVLMGPQTYNDIGAELYPTTNRLVKSINSEHLGDSNISDNGTTVTILSNAVVNGTFSATGTTLVSGSSQINHNTTTNYVANQHIDHTSVSIVAGNGLSGGGTIETNRTMSLDTSSSTFTNGVKSKMNSDGVVSGSSQVSFNGITDKPTLVSGSSQITYGLLTGIPSGIVSGSSQVSYTGLSNIPSGIVSGSVQVDLTATTNYSTGIKTRLNAEGVLSGSSQVVASLPAGTVSGSSQVSYTGLSNIPSGIVSGSSQITFGSISSIPSGLVSGSSQITFGSISSIPSGLVSGSSQITLSSTTGYGSVLNQAVLTSSTPTFAGGTMTGTLTFSAITGNKIDFYYSGDDRYGVQVQSSELRIHSGAQGVSTGGITLGKSTGSVFTEYLRIRNDGLIKAVSYYDAQASSGFRIRNAADSANVGAFTRRGLWEGNSNYDPALWAETGYGLYFYSNGSANIRAYFDTSGHFVPGANGTYNLGSSSARWNTVFTSDLSMSNGIGDYTIVEGEEDLFIYNNKTNKVFKFLLQEVDPSIVPPKKV